MPDELSLEIKNLGANNNQWKPHKLIALYSAIIMLQRADFNTDKVYFSTEYKNTFKKHFKKYIKNENDKSRPHTPFFHLKTSSFWELIPRSGMEQELQNTTTVGGIGDLNRIVDHVKISDELLQVLLNDEKRDFLINVIVNILNSKVSVDASKECYSDLNNEEITAYNEFICPVKAKDKIINKNDNIGNKMSLKTDTFPLKRLWLEHAISTIPKNKMIFSSAHISDARKIFLAGSNQLTAIQNWLTCSSIIERQKNTVELTPLGKKISEHDTHADKALTWWLIHLNLCINDIFPYTAFFMGFEIGDSWIEKDKIIDKLYSKNPDRLALESLKTYFDGIDASFRPGNMMYMLGLLERRRDRESGKILIKRNSVEVCNELVVYALMLLQYRHAKDVTMQTPTIIKMGLPHFLGLTHKMFREKLSNIQSDSNVNKLIKYDNKQNLDSVEFIKKGTKVMESLVDYMYENEVVQWN